MAYQCFHPNPNGGTPYSIKNHIKNILRQDNTGPERDRPRHEDELGSRGIAPRILNLSRK
jgi:hypothetical protein